MPERVLMASLLALMDAPEVRPTLLSILQLIEDEQYRTKVSQHLSNNAAFLYFNRTLAEYRAGEFAQKSSSTSNKIFQIVANPMVANIFGQYHPSFDFADAMRQGKILIFEVPQSALGGHFCHLVCALIASEIITSPWIAPVPIRYWRLMTGRLNMMWMTSCSTSMSSRKPIPRYSAWPCLKRAR